MEVEEGYKDTKIGRIPKDWEVYKFGDVFEFIKTSSHSKAQMTLDETESDIFNVHYGAIHTTYREQLLNFDKYNVPRITDDSKLPKTNQYLKEGDVVIVDASEDAGGMGECVEISNIGQRKVIGGLHTFAVRDKNGLFAKGFAGYIFKNSISRNKLIGVSKGNIVSVPLIIPPLPEQQKIAEILSTVDEQISTTQAIIDKSKELKKGLMQKLFSEGIGHTAFSFSEGTIFRKILGQLPISWKVKELSEISDFKQGVQVNVELQETEPNDENIRFIRIVDYTQDNEDMRYVSKSLIKYEVQGNDIVMVRYGCPGVIGRGIEGIIANNMFKISIDNNLVLNDFFYYFINQNKIQEYLMIGSGSSTMPALNFSYLRKFQIAIPSIEEQQKIAEILSEADAKIEKEEQQKAKLEELKKGLMQQLLTGKKRVKV